jgi:hypothetical protein
LVSSKIGFRSVIQEIGFPVCKPLPSRARYTRNWQKNKKRGINYDETKFACAYLCLHCYSGKIIQNSTCHASETGIQSSLETIFNGATYAHDATKFINIHNLTMLVTRRTYINPSAYTDDGVALLSWTGHNTPVVYIGWAAVSGGQLGADQLPLPSLLADSMVSLMVLDNPIPFRQNSHRWD